MLWDAGLYADADLSDSTLPTKVRNGEIAQYNFGEGALADLSMMSKFSLTVPPRCQSSEVKRWNLARSTSETATMPETRRRARRRSRLTRYSRSL